jgi:hypothetical protein
MSLIPFMRGYAHILKDDDKIYTKLSQLMHGYENTNIDISCIYKTLFGYNIPDVSVSTNDILSLSFDDRNIVDNKRYPLLNNTLYQTLAYYHLRMKVEKKLIETFNISTTSIQTLAQIIFKAFKEKQGDSEEIQKEKRKYRVFFTSRKTLINQFNHFEGNIDLFQPAIDITNTALKKEIDDIEKKLEEISKDMFT